MRTSIQAKHLAKMDMAGMTLSVACAIHCLGTPIFLSALPLLGLEFMGHEGLESVMIVGIAALAGFTFINGYRMHGRKAHFLLGAIGLAVFLVVRPLVDESIEPYATLLGGAFYIVGHFLNWKWSRPCEDC